MGLIELDCDLVVGLVVVIGSRVGFCVFVDRCGCCWGFEYWGRWELGIDWDMVGF